MHPFWICRSGTEYSYLQSYFSFKITHIPYKFKFPLISDRIFHFRSSEYTSPAIWSFLSASVLSREYQLDRAFLFLVLGGIDAPNRFFMKGVELSIFFFSLCLSLCLCLSLSVSLALSLCLSVSLSVPRFGLTLFKVFQI